ncbi:NAD(P)-dependent oxidoreductase [Brucella pseudogrignonensis]|uniref:NAD-dependent epimerase/dehydratase family protein n=1 Tax=Brucella pseudogrignonensis TaxID=419475 RepID=UPI0028B799AD|nr:NAD(P)-dependent oxidoreductase [Brucella pseudogrignonensis]MDT6942567.1 NAD(P)-dependent oxidoreductase [Brucella pseudogrignonensis]
MKKILITGAAGNVGRLIRPLMKDNYRLRVTGRTDFATEEGEEKVIGDLSSPAFCGEVVQGVDGVLHLAGLVGPDLDFEDTLDPNYRAVLYLLEACRAAEVGRFVFASSHHIVGQYPSNRQYDHSVTPAPDGYYGLSKAFGEAASAMYAHRYGIKTMLLRIGNADPKVVDGRRERIWTSATDMVQLIDIGLMHPEINCEVVYSVSNCPDAVFDNSRAEQLGYRPQDFASDHRAVEFQSLSELPAEVTTKVGGFFAVSPLLVPSREDDK